MCGEKVWGEGMGRRYGEKVWGEGMGRRYGEKVWGEGMGRRYGEKVWGEGMGRRCGEKVWGEGMGKWCGEKVWGCRCVEMKPVSMIEKGNHGVSSRSLRGSRAEPPFIAVREEYIKEKESWRGMKD